LRGRTLKGLVTEEVDNVLFALHWHTKEMDRWMQARQTLFGSPGSAATNQSRVRFSNAELPATIRQAVINANPGRELVLESLTSVRRQTAINEEGDSYGVPAEGSLRAMRVILRETPFEAQLISDNKLTDDELALLSAAVMAFRRGGTGRNRGRGRLAADLKDVSGNSLLAEGYECFVKGAFS
jgi:hypothetical protein